MIEEFKLPDVGEGVAEGELVQWLVEPGDPVTEDQPVAEVETDKALVEVPSPYDGTVRELLAEEGEVVPVGTVIITFDVEGEDADEETTERGSDAEADASAEAPDRNAETPARIFAPPRVRRLARELGIDLSAVDGSGPGGRITEADVRTASEGDDQAAATEEGDGAKPAAVSFSGASATAKRDESTTDADADAEPSADAAEAAGRARTLAAPATRRLADESGVDIDDVPASETRDGEAFVTADDVRAYADAQRAAQAADAAALRGESEDAGAGAQGEDADSVEPASASASAESGGGTAAVERVPYRGVRRAIGEQMERSKYTAPHVTHHDTAVVEGLVDLRAELKPLAEERGVRLTYMPFVMKAVVAALKEFPYLNASLDEEAEEILLKKEYNLGTAVATDAGLMVPVVDDVDAKGALELSRELSELVERARERKISREEMQGGTFTITNFGAIGGEYATPIINYPEVAILGLGEITQRPVVEDGAVVARYTLPISLSIDHRVIDGAVAGQFANRLIEYLENPKLLLL